MSNNVKQNPTKVITGKNTRWSYANVWEAKTNAEGQTPKFSVFLIIPKDDVATIAKIKAFAIVISKIVFADNACYFAV